MRKPSTFSLKNEDDSDYSTSGQASTHAYLDETISAHDSYHKDNSDDSDCFSDSSKKIRKKRSAYQKISDDIRLKLLDCVKNGETLKSAAKRFKINYSSAKSILHTFRKEGRILKKSAQERTTKKKSESLMDLDQPLKSARLAKKNSMHLSNEPSSFSRSLNCLNKGNGNSSRETTPPGSLCRLDDISMGGYEHGHHHVSQRGDEAYARGMSGMEQEGSHGDVNGHKGKMSYQEEAHHHNQYKNNYSNMTYFMNYGPEGLVQQPQQGYMQGEGHEHGSYMMPSYSREYDSFNDMVSSLQHRSAQVDDFFNESNFLCQSQLHMEDKFFKNEHEGEYNAHGDNGYMRSFMDTNSMFRDALKKGNQASYSNSHNNNSGYRKGSIDLF